MFEREIILFFSPYLLYWHLISGILFFRSVASINELFLKQRGRKAAVKSVNQLKNYATQPIKTYLDVGRESSYPSTPRLVGSERHFSPTKTRRADRVLVDSYSVVL